MNTVIPLPYRHAVRNPLKGLRDMMGGGPSVDSEGTLTKCYSGWDELERTAEDGPQRIREISDERWRGLPERNIKVIPRVVLFWPPPHPNRYVATGPHWPEDLYCGDYYTRGFLERLERLVAHLGMAWDTDPRVAFVEIGLIGHWGEHHRPDLAPEHQRVLARALPHAFPSTYLLQRYPTHFLESEFGLYWDSFGHHSQRDHLVALRGRGAAGRARHPWPVRWKRAIMGGEMAFDWGTPLGTSPDDALRHHSGEIERLVRKHHWNHLGLWVDPFPHDDPELFAGVDWVHRALGYRFEIREVRYPEQIDPKFNVRISLVIANTGSSPLYYRFPLEVSLLRPGTSEVVATVVAPEVDPSAWLPGRVHRITTAVRLPAGVTPGDYDLALAVLDPAGMRPAIRFATRNYRAGGRHPIGPIGVGGPARRATCDLSTFDDMETDDSLSYDPAPVTYLRRIP